MSRFWVVLGGDNPQILQQEGIPNIKQKGRQSPAFPVYIECQTSDDAQAVFELHKTIQMLCAIHHWEDRMNFAQLVQAVPDFSNILVDVSPLWVILNGVSFKGIILNEKDLHAQTQGYRWSSYRKAYTFKEALLIIILGGEKFSNSGNISISDHMSRLSLYPAPHTSVPLISGSPRPPGLSVGPTTPTRNQVSVKVEKSHASMATGPSTRSTALKDPMIRSQYHPAGSTIPSTPIPTVYKYIRNRSGVVGAITNPAGVTSSVTEDDIAIIGSSRAEYLNAHGFGPDVIACIVDAFQSVTEVHEFISLTAGCGMAVMELEWFWALS